MPRYAYQKPRSRVYSYNYGYMNNYYKPLTHYFDKEMKAVEEQPGHQSLAERLKTFPMDGTIFRERATSAPPSPSRYPDEVTYEVLTPKAAESPEKTARSPPMLVKTVHHPHYLRVEDEVMPHNRGSFWPQGQQFSHLVSSYGLLYGVLLRTLDPIWYRHPWDWDCIWIPPHETLVVPHFGVKPGYQPIWMKHPYRLPVEDIRVPPHESSIWPESVPHFNLVSSYDLMVDFLGIRKPCCC
ncbi:hypothetical protein Hamer_G004696 [Homarus americanus]|uniref:Uncharacterized protein n=1 Tax=Homarus americanus TaxID=6706 RepID=A0A8J5JYQ6_HOMAM|nr:hypothetical protein Hamer_G004696 [Homarus americanus]